ncbi:MAG: DsbE family thiol:disulfide interchange protein [bacterium]
MSRFAAPLLMFVVLAAFLGVGLTLKPRELPSPLIGQMAPAFESPTLASARDATSSSSPSPSSPSSFKVAEMRGQVWLLNVWASWCAACRDEHPLLNRLAMRDAVAIVGLNYKDAAEDAAAWLRAFGNPYTRIPLDRNGDIGIEYGVYGVPETYLIDRDGIIRYKQVGPLTAEILREVMLPMIEKLRAQSANEENA